MTLYLCLRNDSSDDNRDLFVNAETPEEAVAMAEEYWRVNCELDDDELVENFWRGCNPWRTYEAPAASTAPGAVDWESLTYKTDVEPARPATTKP